MLQHSLIMQKQIKKSNRRNFLKKSVATVPLPLFIPSSAFGANERINFAGIGMGGRGRGDLNSFLGFSEIQTRAVCDVVQSHAEQAKSSVDRRYGNNDCKTYVDYREIIMRDDIDAVLIATDHDGIDYSRVVRLAPITIDTRNATSDVTEFREKIVKS